MGSLFGWLRHFPAYRLNMSLSSMGRTTSLTAPGIHSVYRRRCIALGTFIPAASNPANRSIWTLAWTVRRPAVGFFIALFHRPSGGTTLFSPEATCFSSGRKNGLESGAPRMVIPCGRSSRWTSYGHSRPLGIRRAWKRARAVRNPMRCVPSLLALAWEATSGIHSPTVLGNTVAQADRIAWRRTIVTVKEWRRLSRLSLIATANFSVRALRRRDL